MVLQTNTQGAQGNILTDEVDAFVNQVIANWTSPGGAAVAVVKLNEQGEWHVETKGYGRASLNGTKVTENTRFGIGSNSKVSTHSIRDNVLLNDLNDSIAIQRTSDRAIGQQRDTLTSPVVDHQNRLNRADLGFARPDCFQTS